MGLAIALPGRTTKKGKADMALPFVAFFPPEANFYLLSGLNYLPLRSCEALPWASEPVEVVPAPVSP
jgi:hypothetical protein